MTMATLRLLRRSRSSRSEYRISKICPETGEEVEAIIVPGLWYDNNTGLVVRCPNRECRLNCLFPLHPQKKEAIR